MKKILLSFAAFCLTMIIHAQNNAVDEMFNKYSEKEGFTVVSISPKMFNLFSSREGDDKEAGNIMSKLKSLRILSVEDSLLNKNLNFYTELTRKLNLSEYEELMAVKEGQSVTKFLIKTNGKIVTELLVIQGGQGGNSLISIRGEFNLKDLSDISKSMDMKELKSLDNIDKKNP